MLCSLAVAALVSWIPQPADAQLGTAKIGMLDVPVVMPSTPARWAIPPEAAHIEVQAWRYMVLPDGSLGRRYLSDGLWGQAGELYRRSLLAKNSRIDWKVKVFIQTRGEILEQNVDGVWRVRRSTIETRQIPEIYSSLALFKAMAEGASGGALNLSFNVTIDDDPVRLTATRIEPLINEAFLRREIGPRINSSVFETDDKVDRGPFDSIFVVSALMTSDSTAVLLGGQPISFSSYYSNPYSQMEGGLSIALYRSWLWQLSKAAERQGFQVRWPEKMPPPSDPTVGFGDPGFLITPEMWSVISNRRDPSDSAYVARKWRPDSAGSFAWSEVNKDPWGTLPLLVGNPVDSSEDSIIPLSNGDLAVRLFAAELVASGSLQGKVVGFRSGASGPWLEFRPNGPNSAGPKAAALGLEVVGTTDWWKPLSPPAQPSIPLVPSSWGHLAAKTVVDVSKGPSVEVTESKSFRQGEAILATGGNLPMFDSAANPILEFWVHPTVAEPYELQVRDQLGRVMGSVVLGTPPMIPVEVGGKPTPYLPLKVGEWQRAIVDLSKSPADSRPSEIVLTLPPFASYQERTVGGATTFTLSGFVARPASAEDANFKLTDIIEPNEVTQKALQASKIPTEASETDKALLFELLRDPKELVRLNACATLTRVKAPDALSLLIDQSKSASPQIAEMAAKALIYQGTPEAWEAIKTLSDHGPFDFNRQYGSKELGSRKDPTDAGTLAIMMTAKSWHARADAATALGKLPGKDAPVILIAMLQEIEPGVRLAVTEGANTEVELVNRRLLWAAVNDPSEMVRSASFLGLMRSPIAEYKSEGYKGVRNESKAIRLMLLDAMRAKPSEEQRGALRLAVTDQSSEVRAAALRALSALPEPVVAAEIENTFADKDPRVQMALIELASVKKIALPETALQNLRSSVSKDVQSRLAELLK